jgi:hypothetical protein
VPIGTPLIWNSMVSAAEARRSGKYAAKASSTESSENSR